MEESMKGFKSLITGKWAVKCHLLGWQQLRLPALARHKTNPVNRQPCTMEGLTRPDPSPLNYEFWKVVVEGALLFRNAPTGEHQAPWDSSLSLVSQISLTKLGGPQNETKKLLMSERFLSGG